METPLFSIITVCFNSSTTIKDTIESVLNQTYTNIEYIIVDGDSKDNTIQIVKKYVDQFEQRRIPYKWISEKDSGIYEAFNKGIRLSKGQWISFLGSDDIYVPNAIALYKNQIDTFSTQIDFIHSTIKIGNKEKFSNPWKWKSFKRKMTIAHVGGFHNSNYFIQRGDFNEKYKIAGDYELLLRAKETLKTHWLSEVTVIMGDGGISNNQIKKVYLETTKAKIESGKVSKITSKIDYYIWMFKYQIKKILHAVIR